MRRKVIYKSFAIKACAVILALMAILSIFPLRIWQRDIAFGDYEGSVIATDAVDDEHDVVQKFVADYDRLSSVDVYVDSLYAGKYLALVIYNEMMQEAYERYVYLGDANLPGYVNIPLKLSVNVGETYTMVFTGHYASASLGCLENSEAMHTSVLDYAYHDTTVAGIHLAARYHYEQPISKKTSALFIGVIAVIAALFVLVVSLIYRNKKDKLVTVHSVIQAVGNPIALALTLALVISIFPLKVFGGKVIDIVFYEIGGVITGFFLFYGINHENDATLDTKIWHNLMNLLQMCAIAGALCFCTEYMNALFTIYQSLAERKEMICLLLLLCLSFPKERVCRWYNALYAVVAVAAGAFYRNAHLLADTEKEYDLHNAVTTYGVIIAVLAGFIVINIIAEMIHRFKETGHLFGDDRKVSIFGWLIVLFFIVITVFRNTRWWGAVLGIFVFGLMFCYRNFGFVRVMNKTDDPSLNGKRAAKGYSQLIAGGLLLNFVFSMVYCWLYRDFAAFNTGRFPFVFHTVTVTAEYMTVMECAAIVMLLYKIYDTRDIDSFAKRFRYLWKEFILFGFVTAYMIFTVSRTSYLACAVMFICVALLTATDNKKKKFKYFGRQLCTLILAVVITFPAAFTLQRVIPAVVARPQWFLVEPENVAMFGGAQPDSPMYMGIERFVDLFAEKICGVDLMDYNNPMDKYNYDAEGNRIYGINGTFYTPEKPKRAGMDEGSEGEDFTNGRLTIFKAYLEQMNMFGHDEMGAVLPDGEVAVHAHNTYLQVMYDNGIISGVLFLLLVVSAFVSGAVYYVKKNDKESGALLPFAMTIGFGIAALSEWVFQLSNPMTIAFIFAIMPLAFTEKNK